MLRDGAIAPSNTRVNALKAPPQHEAGGGATVRHRILSDYWMPACAGMTLRGSGEANRSRGDRDGLVRRHPRRDARALGAGRQIAHLRNPPGPPRRGEDADETGKNVLLEKPIAMELWEADELITLAKRGGLKFTIGYSQRFNPKFAYAKKKITDGTLGKVVSVMVSRHLSRGLGTKIAKRVKLSPVVMESTHDLDFVFWLLEPAKPVRVYSQGAYGYMQAINGSYDVMWSIVTMDNGMMVTVGGGWNLPPSYPNFCSTWIEILGTDGALILDDTHRDAWLNTVAEGTRFPMSTMPGEQVDHVFAGQMGPETIHFLEACIMDRPVMVTPESARMVMETYTAADLSAERNEPIDLPLSNAALSAVAEMVGGKR